MIAFPKRKGYQTLIIKILGLEEASNGFFFFIREGDRMRKVASSRQEKKVAKAVGGRTTPGSGAGDFKKGDVENKYCLIECKTLIEPKESHRIKKRDLKRIQQQAFEAGKDIAVLAFDFGDGENFYILSERSFLNLMELYAQKIFGDPHQ